jgi:DNA protecting protein DprA
VLTQPAVAIVGSRDATRYALDVAARLGTELAERGIVVTSGLARGVDSAAHQGAVDADGATVAVLGSGLDNIYPREHQYLAETIVNKGVVVSELGPGGLPLAEHFPLRNRIISGISLAVVVVEASEKSGSLITARCAAEQGRDVMAVPGSVLTGRNRGSHSLLKDGAKVVETADDILEELGWPAARAAVPLRVTGEDLELVPSVRVGRRGLDVDVRLLDSAAAGYAGPRPEAGTDAPTPADLRGAGLRLRVIRHGEVVHREEIAGADTGQAGDGAGTVSFARWDAPRRGWCTVRIVQRGSVYDRVVVERRVRLG